MPNRIEVVLISRADNIVTVRVEKRSSGSVQLGFFRNSPNSRAFLIETDFLSEEQKLFDVDVGDEDNELTVVSYGLLNRFGQVEFGDNFRFSRMPPFLHGVRRALNPRQ